MTTEHTPTHRCRPEWIRGKRTRAHIEVCRADSFHVLTWPTSLANGVIE